LAVLQNALTAELPPNSAQRRSRETDGVSQSPANRFEAPWNVLVVCSVVK